MSEILLINIEYVDLHLLYFFHPAASSLDGFLIYHRPYCYLFKHKMRFHISANTVNRVVEVLR